MAYLALTAIGGACIVLYQKKLLVDREGRDHERAQILAEDLARREADAEVQVQSTHTALDEVRDRLDAVTKQRDRESARSDQLFAQLRHLAELSERNRCIFPTPEGARCKFSEHPR